MELNSLTAISPIDGRYHRQTEALSAYFSEFALMQYRVRVEIEYFVALAQQKIFSLPANKVQALRKIYADFNNETAQQIKNLEKVTNHDVKALEYYIKKDTKERCKKGFAPDKKDKTRCIKKASDQTSATKKKHVSIEEIKEMMEKRRKCVEKYRIKYRKMQTKKIPKVPKAPKAPKVPKEPKAPKPPKEPKVPKEPKAPLVSEPPKEESSIISSISNLVKGVL